MNIQPQEIPFRDLYRLLITTVAPRPIAWVSTMNREGELNLAPFSFFNVLSASPPLLGFCPGNRSSGERKALGSGFKDTLQNVRETGEFVVNTVTYPLVEAMNLTSGDYESSVNEFEVAKLTMRPSQHVKPPQVAESPVSFECALHTILEFGTETLGGNLIIGRILSIHMADEILRDGRVDGQLLDLVGRMGGMQYARTTDRFDLARPERKPKQE